jgi:hypothetical protein
VVIFAVLGCDLLVNAAFELSWSPEKATFSKTFNLDRVGVDIV